MNQPICKTEYLACKNDVIIGKVKEEYGWLGNMSPFPIIYNSRKFLTTEALFQSLRFDDLNVIKEIMIQKSPMAAKMVSKKYKEKYVIEPCQKQDFLNMRMCLLLKLEQHPNLKKLLIETKTNLIVEDCTKRQHGSGLFWGCALKNNQWIGENNLGKLWMEIREEYQNE